jgi:hypothetical protein
MANVSFHRKTVTGQKVTTEGAITFNTADKNIYLGTGTSYYQFSCPSSQSATTITTGMFPTYTPVIQTTNGSYASLWGQGVVTSRQIVEAGMEYDGMSVEYCEGNYSNYCTWQDGMPNSATTYGPWVDYIGTTFSKGFTHMFSIDVNLDLYTLVASDYTSLKSSGASYWSIPKRIPVHCVRTPSAMGGNQEFVGYFCIPVEIGGGTQSLNIGVGTLTLFAEGTNAVRLRYAQIEDKSRSDKVRNEADTGSVYNYDYYTTTTVGFDITSSKILSPNDMYYEWYDGYTYNTDYPLLESRINVLRCNVNA